MPGFSQLSHRPCLGSNFGWWTLLKIFCIEVSTSSHFKQSDTNMFSVITIWWLNIVTFIMFIRQAFLWLQAHMRDYCAHRITTTANDSHWHTVTTVAMRITSTVIHLLEDFFTATQESLLVSPNYRKQLQNWIKIHSTTVTAVRVSLCDFPAPKGPVCIDSVSIVTSLTGAPWLATGN